jgi:hypothetical protein
MTEHITAEQMKAMDGGAFLGFLGTDGGAPYIPSAAEAKHLEAALAHLIAAFESRDFEPGEEAVWNCGTITIAGQHKGAWEIRLRQTDCDSDTRRSPLASAGRNGIAQPLAGISKVST